MVRRSGFISSVCRLRMADGREGGKGEGGGLGGGKLKVWEGGAGGLIVGNK